MNRLEIQFQNLRFIHIFSKWVKGLHTKNVDIFITHFEKNSKCVALMIWYES